MKILKSTLVAIAIISISSIGSFAEDGIPSQSGLTQSGQDTTNLGNKPVTNKQTEVKVVSPKANTPQPSASENIDQSAHQSK